MIKINGTQVVLIDDTLRIDDASSERTTASFGVRTSVGTYFSKGQSVEIYDDNSNMIFSGYIDKPQARKMLGADIMIHSIQCTDQHYLADKHIIAEAYENIKAGDIVRDIITKYLAAEGVKEAPAAEILKWTYFYGKTWEDI